MYVFSPSEIDRLGNPRLNWFERACTAGLSPGARSQRPMSGEAESGGSHGSVLFRGGLRRRLRVCVCQQGILRGYCYVDF